MNIIYVSVQCSERFIRKNFAGNDYIPGQQAQKFNRLFAEGFAMQDDTNVYHVTQVPAYKKSIPGLLRTFKKERVNAIEYRYLPVLNIRKMQDVLNVVTSFFVTFFLCVSLKPSFVIMDVLAAPASIGAVRASKLFKRTCIGIVTDVPDILFKPGKDRFYHHYSNKVIEICDGYVLLTKQMSDIMNPRNKPYIVVEGMVDIRQKYDREESPWDDSKKKILLYTGTIHKQYGIKNLVEGFIEADLPDVELHIYGDGDYREELQEICKKNKGVKYYGTILNDEITEKQREAFLLINPRSDEGEYTKYSFPSKNMEYMASGRPVLLKMLPGMPGEYMEYVFELKTADREDICLSIKNILKKSVTELDKKGNSARSFVLQEKNNKRQTQKTQLWIERGEFG